MCAVVGGHESRRAARKGHVERSVDDGREDVDGQVDHRAVFLAEVRSIAPTSIDRSHTCTSMACIGVTLAQCMHTCTYMLSCIRSDVCLGACIHQPHEGKTAV